MTVVINDFYGTIAGQPAYTPFQGGRTYSRILNDGSGVRAIFDFCAQSFREKTFTPDHYWDDHYRKAADWASYKERLHFEVLHKDDQTHLTNHAYALSKVGASLEELTHIPLKDLQHQCNSYGMGYILNRYFEGVETTEEGDLIVYYDQNGGIVHSGIYHACSSTNSGGSVESRWTRGASGNRYVFEHEFFFLPPPLGDVAKFFRAKKTLPASNAPLKHIGDPMFEAQEDGSFAFIPTEANKKVRETIEKTKSYRLPEIYPQIEHVSDINFFGVCFMYAMDKIFKSNYDAVKSEVREGDLCGGGTSEFLEKYFVPVSTPQEGDLAVYSSSWGYRHHFGVYIGEDRIESKWGCLDVYRHPPFYVDPCDGDRLTYYRLKEQSQR